MPLRVGLFTEVYHPVMNGVVASIDTLRAGLQRDGLDVVTFAPHARHDDDDADADDGVVRFPSLPLPTPTGYRLCVPYLRARDRARARTLDIAHAHSPFVSGVFAASHARRRAIPLIYTYHTQFDAYAHYAPFESRFTRAALIAWTRAFADRADIVIAPTHAMRERLRAIGVTTRVDVVPSAIDVARYASGARSTGVRALLGATDRERIILVVARLGREKNVELAIDALVHAHVDLRLAIVGDGPHRAALVARARTCSVEARVRFAGALPPAALPDLYASADAFAFTSLTDTQGLVLGEARAARLPIVASDSAVAHEMAGPDARIVPPEPRAFAAALSAAASGPRGSGAGLADWAPQQQARATESVYRAAQSAVHLALC